MNKRAVRATWLLAAAACMLQAGQISGTITDSNGKGLGAITVRALVKPSDQSAPQSLAATTAADGTFSIPNAPAGTYRICTPGVAAFVDPCSWSKTPVSGSVANGNGSTKAGTIALEAGALVQVKVVDDKGALKQNADTTPGTHLMVGVWTPDGLFVPMAQSAQGGNGERTYQGYVPYSKTVRVSVTATGFALNDGNSKALAADGGLGDLQVTPGSKVAPIVVHVAGVTK